MPKHVAGTAAWERQQGESPQAFEAFSVYRDLGDERSIRKVAAQLNKSATLIQRWSKAWNWPERAREYDNSLQAQAYKEAVKRTTEMQTRHIKTAVLMQKKAVEALDKLKPGDLEPKDIIRLIAEGAKMERAARLADPAIVSQQKREEGDGEKSSLADAIMEAWEKRVESDDA